MIALRNSRAGHIPQSVIDTALHRHPDGYGIAWREAGTVRTAKYAPAQRKAFRRHLRKLDKRFDIEYAAHFRMATQGPAVQALAHPFTYKDAGEGTVAIVHNGIINIHAEAHESDTEVFVRNVLATLPTAWWRDPAQRYLVSEAIGYSKLVVMTATETVIINESLGEWDGGLWYSSSHRKTPATGWSGKGYSAASSWESAYHSPAQVTAEGALVPAARDTVYDGALATEEPDGYTFRHGGHTVTALQAIERSRDGDYLDAVLCESCYTTGDVYVIDGGVLIDMAHTSGPSAPRENDADTDDERIITSRVGA
jgi:hypothetical protein